MVPILFEESVRIPADIVDLETFRRWARSEEFPDHGRFSYLRGEMWVDLSPEQLFSHNQVKTRFTAALDNLAETGKLGFFFSDRARLSNPGTDLSTEPDGVFVSYDAVRGLRVRFDEGQEGPDEIVGSPDMVLEVVSDTSVRKDTQVLRQLYWAAEVTEYWLVDARAEVVRFDILRRGKRGYTATRAQDGWLHSGVFGRSFRLMQQVGPDGQPWYTLEVRE